jgi:hypothetical protein
MGDEHKKNSGGSAPRPVDKGTESRNVTLGETVEKGYQPLINVDKTKPPAAEKPPKNRG